MLEETLSYYKSQLKHAAKSGPQFVTIESAVFFADETDKKILRNGKEGIVVRFRNDNIDHEELYWITGPKFNDICEIKYLLGHIPTKEFVGKKLWIVIRHNITLDSNQNEVKREAEIVHYSVGEKVPEYPAVFEEYDIAAI